MTYKEKFIQLTNVLIEIEKFEQKKIVEIFKQVENCYIFDEKIKFRNYVPEIAKSVLNNNFSYSGISELLDNTIFTEVEL